MQLSFNLLLFPLLFATLGFVSCGPGQTESDNKNSQSATTTFILVRHAEKENGSNPELTGEGTARAARLRERLKDRKIAAVYSTATNRTMATARPTAERAKLKITDYDPGNPTTFARELISRHRGQTVLIVGHSNTVPDLANALSGKKQLSDFDESDYGNFITVTINGKGEKTLTTKRY